MDALGLIEVGGFAASLVALDILDKAADVRLLQVELNDQLGALIKIAGETAAVQAGARAAAEAARAMAVGVVVDVINAPATQTRTTAASSAEFSPLLEADVVFIPGAVRHAAAGPQEARQVNKSFALGLIETQGLTAVLEALDTAAKAADVQVVGREKLGGGYVTVIIKGDVAAVQAAVEAGKARVEGLGKLIAAHVIARPSEAVLSILPNT